MFLLLDFFDFVLKGVLMYIIQEMSITVSQLF